ncbi:MAG: ferritin [Anaerolineae bacterium]
MLSERLQKAMNDQVKNELYSAYLYLSMATYFHAENLPGMAHWMEAQAQEEVEHAMKFYGYLYDRNARVVLQAIEQPPSDFGSPLGAFKQALEHEQKVTAMINNLYAMAVEDKDYASQSFLQWFIDEQVEEEKSATDIIAQLEMIGDNKVGLIMLDRQLAQR